MERNGILANISKNITIVDARMGRGKSSAAIRYMNENKGKKCFLYITPYLSETERVCELCDFEEPNSEYTSKSARLKELMKRKENIASTHSLFNLMDNEALELAKENHYNLIIDESINVIQGVSVTPKDKQLLMDYCIDEGEGGVITWRDSEYSGRFSNYKEMADDGALYYRKETFYEVMNPKRFLAFNEIFMLTYLFEGQLQKAYFDYYGFTYNIVGVEEDNEGYHFTDKPDAPPPIDYSGLIHIIGENESFKDRMNKIGENRTALSVSWFDSRHLSHPQIKELKNGLRNFFEHRTGSNSKTRLWTTFKKNEHWMFGANNRYKSSFAPLNARATNTYRSAESVAYLANRFIDPNIAKFFYFKDITIDADVFALSEMLQFIWRSAIRDGKEISLYIPSKRMRDLLIGWMNTMNGEAGDT